MEIRAVMNTEPVSIPSDRPVAELEHLMVERHVTGVPVVDGGRVVGIVSRSDVVRQLDLEQSRLAEAAWYLEPFDVEELRDADRQRVAEALGARWAGLHVADLMVKDVVSVAPQATLQEAAACMVERRVHRLLVLQEGRLVGIVSALDLLRAFAAGA